jgi:uncharacterized lipoprotein YehR (DUF1307 family)
MKMEKSKLAKLLVALVLVLGITGCGSDSEVVDTNESDTLTVKTVEIK